MSPSTERYNILQDQNELEGIENNDIRTLKLCRSSKWATSRQQSFPRRHQKKKLDRRGRDHYSKHPQRTQTWSFNFHFFLTVGRRRKLYRTEWSNER